MFQITFSQIEVEHLAQKQPKLISVDKKIKTVRRNASINFINSDYVYVNISNHNIGKKNRDEECHAPNPKGSKA